MLCWFRQGQGAALRTMKENFANTTFKNQLKFKYALETLKSQWRQSFLHFENSILTCYSFLMCGWQSWKCRTWWDHEWGGGDDQGGGGGRGGAEWARWQWGVDCSGDRTGNIGRFYIMNQCVEDQQSKSSINEAIDSDMIDTDCKVKCFCCRSDGCYKE